MELGLITRDDLGPGVQQIETEWAYILIGFPGKNGLCVMNKPIAAGDPPEIRFIDPLGASGKWSFCIGDDPATAIELFMFQGKKQERTRGKQTSWGEGSMHVRGPRRWEGENADGKRDDQMYEVMRILHDMVWVKNLKTSDQFTGYPAIDVPENEDGTTTPDAPPAPVEPDVDLQAWLAQDAKHRDELDAIAREFAAIGGPEFVPDEKTREAYKSGRNRNLKSIHDDMVDRAGQDPGPCQWKQ